MAWGAVGWGLGAYTSNWGYNAPYYNPYYASSDTTQSTPYDYSQPVVINNYVSSDAQGGEATGGEAQAAASDPAAEKGLADFDAGLAKFKSGDYRGALGDWTTALKQLPGDPVAHEARCLALFAVGDYTAAAAGLNSLLSSAPGMDWTTMSGLYGTPDDYTTQLRKLEQYCKGNPSDSAAYFVLAYHYLVIDSKENAIKALRVVVKNKPMDVTAKRMLDALAPPADTTSPPGSPTAAPPEAGLAQTADDSAQTDLVGSWSAKAGTTNIQLTIGEDSQFTWIAKPQGQGEVKLTGKLTASAEGISLESPDQGAMAGTVISKGPDAWLFAMSGAPKSDPGLSFSRMNR